MILTDVTAREGRPIGPAGSSVELLSKGTTSCPDTLPLSSQPQILQV